jgi:hypothetical protein
MSACSAQTEGTGGTRATGSGNGNTSTGTGNGAGGSMGTGGSTGSGGSVTTGGGGGPPPINPGNPDATIDIRGQADAQCAGDSTRGIKKPTDILMMIDSSGSMNEIDTGQTATRWQNLTQAIPPFVSDPANAGMMVGLDFFPELTGTQASCNATDYQNLEVQIGLIPGPNNMQATALSNAVTVRMPTGGTPTVPALTGALTTAKNWQMMNLDRSINVLFMTDGEPQGCQGGGNNVNGAAQVASQFANGMPPVKTFVLGVGPSTGPLDTIAAAGGTTKAYMVTSGGAAELTKALADIRKSTLACDYNIPKSDAGMVDTTKVAVQVRVGEAGGFVDIPNVVRADGCNNPATGGVGWYYDPPAPAPPTKIVLCPNSCGPLQLADGSEVSIVLGCVPRVIPPPN